MPGPSAAALSSFYQKVYDYTIPSDKPTSCTTNKTEYNTRFRDTNTQLDLLRNSNCLANDTKYAEELERNAQEKDALLTEYNQQKEIFGSYMDSVDVLQNARGPFDTYMAEMKAEMEALTTENYELQQSIRAGRRRFMDAQPQSGVASFLGLKTSDNRVLLIFWVTFVTAIVALTILLLLQFGEALGIESTKQKIAVIVGTVGITAAVAYIIIRQFA
jgi:hypothetical protein